LLVIVPFAPLCFIYIISAIFLFGAETNRPPFVFA
jgi:hypothetical protein